YAAPMVAPAARAWAYDWRVSGLFDSATSITSGSVRRCTRDAISGGTVYRGSESRVIACLGGTQKSRGERGALGLPPAWGGLWMQAIAAHRSASAIGRASVWRRRRWQ